MERLDHTCFSGVGSRLVKKGSHSPFVRYLSWGSIDFAQTSLLPPLDRQQSACVSAGATPRHVYTPLVVVFRPVFRPSPAWSNSGKVTSDLTFTVCSLLRFSRSQL